MKRFHKTPGKNENNQGSVLVVKRRMILKGDVRIDDAFADVLDKQNVVAKLADGSPLMDAAGEVPISTLARPHGLDQFMPMSV